MMRSIRSAPPPRLRACDRDGLLGYFQNTWQLYEWLFGSIESDETYFLSPDPLRNPLIFYLGHTAAFYVNKLRLAGLMEQGVDAHFDQLFAVGVDPASATELAQQPVWPQVDAVRSYRAAVYERITELLKGHLWPQVIGPKDAEWALLMGMEHDRIHFETSSVLIRQLPTSLLRRPVGWEYAPANTTVPNTKWVEVPSGNVRLGLSSPEEVFGWDNEFGHLECGVAPFAVSSAHVTNAEYLPFVESKGYQNPEWWSPQGWAWLQSQGHHAPKFWVEGTGGYGYRAMFDELAMPMDWPVQVTCHEALAYCKWAGEGHRLMTEAEWRLLADDAVAWADPNTADGCYNLHIAFGSPRPSALAASQGSLGVADIIGNVWDWVSNDFYPLPGFETHPLYPDFSQPYFDSDHGMMLGGSWASTGTSASTNYRLWFRREFMQHAGFRMAISI